MPSCYVSQFLDLCNCDRILFYKLLSVEAEERERERKVETLTFSLRAETCCYAFYAFYAFYALALQVLLCINRSNPWPTLKLKSLHQNTNYKYYKY